MKLIPLTKGKFSIVDDDMYEYLSQWKWHYHVGYAARCEKTETGIRKILMHRFVNNTPEGMHGDITCAVVPSLRT